MALDRISFLAGRHVVARRSAGMRAVAADRPGARAREVDEFERSSKRRSRAMPTTSSRGSWPSRRDKLRRLPRYYAALARRRAVSAASSCNAPWMSVVVEADGAGAALFLP